MSLAADAVFVNPIDLTPHDPGEVCRKFYELSVKITLIYRDCRAFRAIHKDHPYPAGIGNCRQLSTGWPSPAERRTAVLAGDLHDFGGDFLDLLLGQGRLGRGQGNGYRHRLLALANTRPFI